MTAVDTPARYRVLTSTEELGHDEWLQWRRRGIGGSDAPAILGQSSFGTPWTVWVDKVEGTPGDDAGERARWGKRLEPVIADVFAEETGLDVTERRAILQHRDVEWMIGDIDRFVVADGVEQAVVEVKATDFFMRDDWEDGDVPVRVQIQTQHYLAVTDLRLAYVVVLIGGNRLETRIIERDDLLIADLMAVEERFWRMVENRTPPKVDGTELTTSALKRRFGRSVAESSVVLPDSVLELVDRRAEACARKKRAEEEVQLVDNELRLLLGEHEVGVVAGSPVVTWRGSERRCFQLDRFRSAHPDLAEEFTTREPVRRLHYPKRKGI